MEAVFTTTPPRSPMARRAMAVPHSTEVRSTSTIRCTSAADSSPNENAPSSPPALLYSPSSLGSPFTASSNALASLTSKTFVTTFTPPPHNPLVVCSPSSATSARHSPSTPFPASCTASSLPSPLPAPVIITHLSTHVHPFTSSPFVFDMSNTNRQKLKDLEN